MGDLPNLGLQLVLLLIELRFLLPGNWVGKTSPTQQQVSGAENVLGLGKLVWRLEISSTRLRLAVSLRDNNYIRQIKVTF